MKRILNVITTQFVSFGGLTTVAMNYFRAMDKSEFTIDFASTNEAAPELEAEIEAQGSRYFQLPRRSSGLRYISALTEIAKGYDVVHVHANSATAALELLAAKRAGVPKRIVTIHTSKCEHKVLHRLLKPLFDACYTDAIACSAPAGDWIFGAGNFSILNNAIDTDKCAFSADSRAEIRELYGLGERFVIGHVGKLYEPKNHTFLIDIFHEYVKTDPQAVLLLVGDGEKRGELADKVSALGIEQNVIFAGMQRHAERYYAAFDCLVFPSLYEGMPLSALEAQASGLKCVLSDRITPEANVTGKVQFLSLDAPLSDWCEQIALCKSYDRAAESEENRRSMRENHYDAHCNADTLKRIYLGE